MSLELGSPRAEQKALGQLDVRKEGPKIVCRQTCHPGFHRLEPADEGTVVAIEELGDLVGEQVSLRRNAVATVI